MFFSSYYLLSRSTQCLNWLSLKMAKGSRGRRRIASQQYRSTPYGLAACNRRILENLGAKKSDKALNKDWEDAICSVCMEYPHNAVLLLCSSYEKGCRPYMCGTSCRYSNCLDQYKKAYTKVSSLDHAQPLQNSADNTMISPELNLPNEKSEVMELACPLCRGQVKGWTVVEPAREYLNAKKRNCMQDNCTFLGTYKELRKHVKTEHPSARPRDVDPTLEQRWRRLEQERERDDVISTIRATMPGAMVFGDYVIEGNHYGLDVDESSLGADRPERNGGLETGFDSNLFNVFMLLHAFGQSGNVDLRRRLRHQERALQRASDRSALGGRHTTTPVGGSDVSDQENGDDSNDDNAHDASMSLVSRLRRHGRVLLGRSSRRRRRREGNGNQDR
ncbi:uncharacterized protein LOC115679599 isoform X1 [Syzygium oleosum]|uniref:uncharacterized protein LOC115679599 isoform X1 n=2 Tax=Syzygium oleosum TaxID=219896 RepID=UPI0011D274F4|nr:uncharacterized protein LOC115679599 isoform X1 [Syzygium oleosum]